MICTLTGAVAWGLFCRYKFEDVDLRLFPVVSGAIVIGIACGVLGLP